jgi:hypothetical protein
MAETLLYQGVAINPENGLRVRLGHNVETMSGTKRLTPQDAQFQLLDPNGGNDLMLPAEEASQGLFFIVKNTTAAAENIEVKNDAGSGKETLGSGKWGVFMCDGTSWETLGVLSFA